MLLIWTELGFSQPQQHNQSTGGGSRYSYIVATPGPSCHQPPAGTVWRSAYCSHRHWTLWTVTDTVL